MVESILQLILTAIQFIVHYLVPLAILSAILAYATYITFGSRGRPLEVLPRIIGYGVGYLILIGVVILHTNGYLDFDRHAGPLDIWQTGLFGILSFLLGFFLLLLFQFLIRSRVAGFLIMSLVGGASVSCFFFVFLSEIRDILMVGTVAFLIGVGIYAILFPEAIKKTLGR